VSVLFWWLIPILATALAIVWVWWRSREGASQAGKVTSAKELDKMARALNKPLPARHVAGDSAPSVDPADFDSTPATSQFESDPDSEANRS
jgi:hypothetical protein